MKRVLKTMAVACLCSLMVLALMACGSPEVSRKSDESMSVQSETAQKVSTDPIYVLLIGNDSRYKTVEDKEGKIKAEDPSYSDTIMLMRLDPAANRIGIVSVPRDTATDVDGTAEKINAVHLAHGPAALAKEVGSMFGVNVSYYFDLKFIDFKSLVDTMGGATLDVPMTVSLTDITTGDKITVNSGKGVLNGAEALVVSRVRKAYSDNGEAIRQMISRDIVANAIQSIASKPGSDAAAYAKMLAACGESNMPEDQLTAYVQAFIDKGGSIAFNLGTAPYVGGIDDSGKWRIARDPNAYAALAAGLENGSDLTAIVPLPSVN